MRLAIVGCGLLAIAVVAGLLWNRTGLRGMFTRAALPLLAVIPFAL